MDKIARRRQLREGAASLGKVLLFALLFRGYVAQAYYIPSESMVPTLEVGDRIFVNRLVYQLRDPARGEVVVFDHPREHGTNLIKRVVAVAGDRVEGRDGQAWVNGRASGPADDFSSVEVPRDNLFVMGDNRGNSSDSRYWGFVPLGLVKGRAMIVWWSAGEPDGIRLRRMFHLIQ